MSFLANKKKRKIFIIVMSLVLVIVIAVSACAIYLGDYYHATISAIAPMEGVSLEILEDGTMVFSPEEATKGFIFYPGGKVEAKAYQPLMATCAEEGIMCVLVEMPFNLAVFDINAADGIQEQHPEIKDWYIGGHSLGGSMAATYLSDNADDYEGLILLASYSTADLSDTDLEVLSVYGSEDKVLNAEKYDKYRSNLPDAFTEKIIEGGCHAYFGMYGEQSGDGVATLTPEEQIELTAEEIAKVINQ